MTEATVVIPARNEAERVAACLGALVGQGARAVLVVNGTSDDTAGIARRAAEGAGLALDIIECSLAEGQGAGAARAIGCAAALAADPEPWALLTTDADCVVAPDWVARNLHHLGRVDACCGRVGLIEAEAPVVAGFAPGPATLEARYRDLVLGLYGRAAPERCNPWPHHGEVPGASLGFRAAAYRAVGGFGDLASGEDRDIVRRLKLAGFDVRHADDVWVRASCRLTGRAPMGMADALRARLAHEDYRVDATLPPARWLIARAKDGTLGPWPPEVPEADRLRVSDLPREIALLEGAALPAPA